MANQIVCYLLKIHTSYLQIILKHYYFILRTVSFYYKPMVHPVSISSLCGQNYERQHLMFYRGCKKFVSINIAIRKPLLIMEKSFSIVEHQQIIIYLFGPRPFCFSIIQNKQLAFLSILFINDANPNYRTVSFLLNVRRHYVRAVLYKSKLKPWYKERKKKLTNTPASRSEATASINQINKELRVNVKNQRFISIWCYNLKLFFHKMI